MMDVLTLVTQLDSAHQSYNRLTNKPPSNQLLLDWQMLGLAAKTHGVSREVFADYLFIKHQEKQN